MNKDKLRKLIRVYAKNSVTAIEGSSHLLSDQLGMDWDGLNTLQGFTKTKEDLKQLKQELEQIEDETSSMEPPGQVIEYLKLIKNKAVFRRDDLATHKKRMDLLANLIREKYYKKNGVKDGWENKEVNHFEFLYPKLRDWNIFFLSYANKGANILRKEFRETIEKFIDEYELETKHSLKSDYWKGNNLIAEMIIQGLSRDNYKGFYDKQNMKFGDPLSETIKKQCQNSFLFIQIITKDSFYFQNHNWSYEEYITFKNSREKIKKKAAHYGPMADSSYRFAIFDSELEKVRPKNFFPSWEHWYEDIPKKVYYNVPPNSVNDFKKMIESLADSINTFLEEELIAKIAVDPD